jgi:hypothetical protein
MRLRQKAGMLASGIVGGLVAAIVLMALPAMGVTGGSFVLGRQNTAENRTALKGATETANLRVENTADKPALSLATSEDAPPMAVNSKKKVTNLNADTVDGLDSADLNDADSIDGLDSADLKDADTIDDIDSADIAHDLRIVHVSGTATHANSSFDADCPTGTVAISGGAHVGSSGWVLRESFPFGFSWVVELTDVRQDDGIDAAPVEIFAVCAPATAVTDVIG